MSVESVPARLFSEGKIGERQADADRFIRFRRSVENEVNTTREGKKRTSSITLFLVSKAKPFRNVMRE